MAAETKVLEIDFTSTIQEIITLKIATAELTEQNKELKKVVEGNAEALEKYEGSIEDARLEMEKNNSAIRLNKQEIKENQRAVDAMTKSVTAQAGSIEANRAQLKVLTEQYLKLGKPTFEQTKRINDLTNTLKRQESAIGNNTRNVGNYTASINESLKGIKLFGTDVGAISNLMSSSGVSIKGATTSLGGFSKALVATGVGALVLALGYLIANFDKVQKAITDNREAINKYTKVLFLISAPLALTIKGLQFLQDNLAEIQQTLVGLSNVAETVFSAIADAVNNLADLNFAGVKESFSNLGAEAQKSFHEGQEQERKRQEKVAQDEIEKAAIERAKLELNVLEASGVDTFAMRKSILKRELALLEAGSKEFVEKQNEIDVLVAEHAKERADKAEEDRKKADKKRVEDADKVADQINKVLNDAAKDQEKRLKDRLDDDRRNFDEQELIAKEAFARGEINQKEFNQRISDLKVQESESQIEILESFGQEVVDKENELANLRVDNEIAAKERNFEHDKEIAERKKELEEWLLEADAEIQDARVQIADDTFDLLEGIAEEASEAQRAAFLAGQGVAVAQAVINTVRTIQAIQVGTQEQVASAALIPFPASVPIIAAIETKGLVKSILAGVQGGIAVAKIASTTIKSFGEGGDATMIDVGGKPHSHGGTLYVGDDGNMFEAEKGEGVYVVKRTAQDYINSLSNINRMFGGNSLTGKPTRYAALGGNIATSFDGGLAARESALRVNEALFAEQIIKGMQKLPPAVVRVTEINNVQSSGERAVDVSNL